MLRSRYSIRANWPHIIRIPPVVHVFHRCFRRFITLAKNDSRDYRD
eukprot:COSAG02_NODE_45752_length_354_cov_0.929412_1_plen_45_part_10